MVLFVVQRCTASSEWECCNKWREKNYFAVVSTLRWGDQGRNQVAEPKEHLGVVTEILENRRNLSVYHVPAIHWSSTSRNQCVDGRVIFIHKYINCTGMTCLREARVTDRVGPIEMHLYPILYYILCLKQSNHLLVCVNVGPIGNQIVSCCDGLKHLPPFDSVQETECWVPRFWLTRQFPGTHLWQQRRALYTMWYCEAGFKAEELAVCTSFQTFILRRQISCLCMLSLFCR